MVCRLPDRMREALAEIKDCQKYNPSDSMGGTEPCVQVMERAMRRVTERYLGRGNFRHAWAYSQGNERCVVKVANNEVKKKHNVIEADAWETAPKQLKRWLTPVTDSDPNGLWLVMPEANTNLPVPNRWNMGRKLEDVFASQGYALADQHEGNVGLLHGHPVSIDYGFGLERYTRGRTRTFRSPLQSRQEEEFTREVSRRAPVYTQWFTGGGKKPSKEELEELGFKTDRKTGRMIDVETGEELEGDFWGEEEPGLEGQLREDEMKKAHHFFFDFGPRKRGGK